MSVLRSQEHYFAFAFAFFITRFEAMQQVCRKGNVELNEAWKKLEGYFSDSTVKLSSGDGDFIRHDEGFTAFIASKFRCLLTDTIVTPRIRLTNGMVHDKQRRAFYKAADATTPEQKLEAVNAFIVDVDGYIAAKKCKQLQTIGKGFVWYVCPACPGKAYPMLDLKGVGPKICDCGVECTKGFSKLDKPKVAPGSFARKSLKKRPASAVAIAAAMPQNMPFILAPENKQGFPN